MSANDGDMSDHAWWPRATAVPRVDPGARRVLAAIQNSLDGFYFVQCGLHSQLQPLVCRVGLKSAFGFFQLGLRAIQQLMGQCRSHSVHLVSLGNLVRKHKDFSFKLMRLFSYVAGLSDPRALRGKLNATGSVFDEPKQL